MTPTETTFAATLVRDSSGHIVYTRRGSIERGPRYDWRDGYSATTVDGGVLYPWLTKAECRRAAKRFGSKAVFVEAAR